MIKLEQIRWVMENHDADITKVKLESDRVCAKLESWIDPGQVNDVQE